MSNGEKGQVAILLALLVGTTCWGYPPSHHPDPQAHSSPCRLLA